MGVRRMYTFVVSIVILILYTGVNGKAAVIELDEDNWHQMLEGEWMVEFCRQCLPFRASKEDFGNCGERLGARLGKVDALNRLGKPGKGTIQPPPSISQSVKDGVFRQYRGSRDKDEFMSFIEEKRWESLEEVPAWKSPASMQMSIVSQFFKLSMVLRGVHSVLVEEYGLPTWGSYLVFALATILVGALLGLV
ncbi:unnamed protein product, partial [Meganyctiphanes norvegica]